jgi:hypothetical protein
VQFVVHQRHEPVQSGLIALAPVLQQPGHILRRGHAQGTLPIGEKRPRISPIITPIPSALQRRPDATERLRVPFYPPFPH